MPETIECPQSASPNTGPGLRGLVIDVAFPWVTLQVLERARVSTVWALAAAAVFPAIACSPHGGGRAAWTSWRRSWW